MPRSKVGATQQFKVGGGVMSLGSIPQVDESLPAKVVGSWEAWGMPAIAWEFDPKEMRGSEGCGFVGGGDGGVVTVFRCEFGCSPQGDA